MYTKFFESRYPGLVILAILVILALLSACSGGNIDVAIQGPTIPPLTPLQTSEDITTHGTITGLGDVTVNDVRYTANAASVVINGQPGTLSDLEPGQIVTVSGRISSLGMTGTANRITYDAQLIGPVENLDSTNNQMTVMGQTVMTGPDTRFGAGINPATFAGLSIGSIVQISGYNDAAGAIRAMWIGPDFDNTDLQLIGKVAGLDLANLLFSINRLTVDYSNTVFIDLPGGAPVNGLAIKAIGTMSGGLFAVERLVTAPAVAGSNGRRVQVAGMITRFNSSTDFDLNDSAITVNTGTAFVNGDAGDLTLNTELLVDGVFAAAERITANRVSVGRAVNDTATLTYGFRDFSEISVPTVFNVNVTRDPDFAVEVVVDAEAAGRVDVSQTGARLSIALLPGDGDIQSLEAFVTMPRLDSIDLTGVVNATVNGFTQAQMTVNVDGVSRLRGNALTIDELSASISGVSQLAFGDTRPIGSADINLSGVSQATVNMDVASTLTGTVATGQGTGTSTLFYYGTDVIVSVTTDFSSSLVRLGDTRP